MAACAEQWSQPTCDAQGCETEAQDLWAEAYLGQIAASWDASAAQVSEHVVVRGVDLSGPSPKLSIGFVFDWLLADHLVLIEASGSTPSDAIAKVADKLDVIPRLPFDVPPRPRWELEAVVDACGEALQVSPDPLDWCGGFVAESEIRWIHRGPPSPLEDSLYTYTMVHAWDEAADFCGVASSDEPTGGP